MALPRIIPEPLWSLMCSAHGCDPACGCDADFEISVRAMLSWIDENEPGQAVSALEQIEALIAQGPGVAASVGEQCRRRFAAPQQAIEWLREWRAALTAAIRTIDS
jgi:hypothetical protein